MPKSRVKTGNSGTLKRKVHPSDSHLNQEYLVKRRPVYSRGIAAAGDQVRSKCCRNFTPKGLGCLQSSSYYSRFVSSVHSNAV